MSDPQPPLAPRPAATLVLVRDAAVGIEVLLVQRAERGDQNSGAWVFPGGLVDAGDHRAAELCIGLNDAQASARLGVAEGGLALHVAALRECFEEVGLLLARDAQGNAPVLDAAAAARLAPLRTALHGGTATLATLCGQAGGVRLDAGRLAYLSHWLTPLGRAKRFDTRFFVAEAPLGQVAVPDGSESVALRWVRPADALADGDAGLKLMTPTLATLRTLARFDSVGAVMQWAGSPREIGITMPRLGSGAAGQRTVMPDEPAWAELGRLDPAGHGRASCELRPGTAVRLSERVVRVTAGNGSVMTGPGTNTYLVASGNARNEWAAIDPGPDDDAHVRAILDAAPGPIAWILATHTHVDHSPACAALHAGTAAPVHGRIADHPEWQDPHFAPQVPLAGGERLVLGPATSLRVIHTPGHASNHLCYLLEEEATLFTGDHVMQSSTVVINPPDGDMAAYVASLRSLAALELDWLAPGHGFLMAQPRRAIQAIVEHRGKREAKVVDALRDLGPATVAALLAQVYDDVPAHMHGVATRSLRAHLIKLRDEGRALERAGDGSDAHWALAP